MYVIFLYYRNNFYCLIIFFIFYFAIQGKEPIDALFKEKLEHVPEKNRENLLKMVVDHFENPTGDRFNGRYVNNGRRSRGGRFQRRPLEVKVN